MHPLTQAGPCSTPSKSDTTEYREAIHARMRAALQHGPLDLTHVVRSCAGAFPSDVVWVLEKLSETETRRVVLEAYELRERQQTTTNEATVSAIAHLEGNPVLCSWYFTSECCRRIGELRDWSRLRLAFLGTPRLYEWFHLRRLGRECLLLDLDAFVIEALSRNRKGPPLNIRRYDVADPIPSDLAGQFDVVFVDPPWYPERYPIWLDRAHTLAPCGLTLFVLFPELTRPGAEGQRNQLLASASERADDLEVLRSYVDYDIPTYEKGQLASCGLAGIGPWKIADLVSVRLRQRISKDSSQIPLQLETWQELQPYGIRVFVNIHRAEDENSGLFEAPTHLPPLLPSPSLRFPGRVAMNVLTSRGHGLVTKQPYRLVQILKQLENMSRIGTPVAQALDRIAVDGTARSILRSVFAEDRRA